MAEQSALEEKSNSGSSQEPAKMPEVSELEEQIKSAEKLNGSFKKEYLAYNVADGNKTYVYVGGVSGLKWQTKESFKKRNEFLGMDIYEKYFTSAIDGRVKLTKYEIISKEKTVVEWQGLKPIIKKVLYEKRKKIWSVSVDGEILSEYGKTEGYNEGYKMDLRIKAKKKKIVREIKEKLFQEVFGEIEGTLAQSYKTWEKPKK
jgi:hypothetical protein